MSQSRYARFVPVLVLVPALGLASASTSSADDSTADATETTAAVARFRNACRDGNAHYAARDFVGAVAAYQKAIEIDPNNALGHYFLGEAQLAGGNLVEAEAAWNRASLAATAKEAPLRTRVLFVLADLKERQKKWDEAKAAWQVYIDWAARFPDAGAFPASALSRQQVIDAMQKQDKAYAAVRQRIADTKAGGVFTDLSKSPPK